MNKNLRKIIMRECQSIKSRLFFFALLIIGSKLLVLASPWLLKLIVDSISKPEIVTVRFEYILLLYVASMFLSHALSDIKEYLTELIVQPILAKVSSLVFEGLIAKPAAFFIHASGGRSIRDIGRAMSSLQTASALTLHTALPTLIEYIVILIAISFTNGIEMLAVLLLTLIAHATYTHYSVSGYAISRNRLNEIDSGLAGKISELHLNYETVKAFGGENVESSKFKHMLNEYSNEAINFQRLSSRMGVSQQIIIHIGLMFIILHSGIDAINGNLTAGDFVFTVTLCVQIFGPIGFLGSVWKDYKKAIEDIRKIDDYLAPPTDNHLKQRSPDKNIKLQNHKNLNAEFKSVSFNYFTNKKTLDNISFSIEPRGLTIICGASGSGKSTVLRLLIKLYEPTAGEILFGGINSNSINQENFRSAISFVSQESYFISGTIEENLRYGNKSATEQEIIECTKSVHLHEFINALPNGYQTHINERSLVLSGGQRQRLSIARALLSNPSILVLDEPTSSLDYYSESEVIQLLSELSRSMACVMTTHRLRSVLSADRIIVLKDGCVDGIGTHDELLKRSVEYSRLFESGGF